MVQLRAAIAAVAGAPSDGSPVVPGGCSFIQALRDPFPRNPIPLQQRREDISRIRWPLTGGMGVQAQLPVRESASDLVGGMHCERRTGHWRLAGKCTGVLRHRR